MILFEQPLEPATLLIWETTPKMREANMFGLEQQVMRACHLNPTEIARELPIGGYMVIGWLSRIDWSMEQEHLLDAYKRMHFIDEKAVPLYVYDLYRQGYLGDGFYIIRFVSDKLPTDK